MIGWEMINPKAKSKPYHLKRSKLSKIVGLGSQTIKLKRNESMLSSDLIELILLQNLQRGWGIDTRFWGLH